MTTVEVVVPYAGDCPHRAAALDWVLRRYTSEQPSWRVTVAANDNPGLLNGWVKADVVNPAVAASTADIVVVADGDVWCPHVDEAVLHVAAGRHEWAVPHGKVHRFTPEHTRRVLGGADPAQHTSVSLVERPRLVDKPGGGVVVANRATLLDVPLDPRFTGWGGEDVAWGFALRCLHGRPWRGAAPLWHLWHPPQDRPGRSTLPPDNDALCRRYHAAAHHPADMRALIDEYKENHR